MDTIRGNIFPLSALLLVLSLSYMWHMHGMAMQRAGNINIQKGKEEARIGIVDAGGWKNALWLPV